MVIGKKSIAVAVMIISLLGLRALACPFCSTVSQTFSEEMGASEIAVIAELVELAEPPPAGALPGQFSVSESKFRVVSVLKGRELIEEGALGEEEEITALYFGGGEIGDRFYLTGMEYPEMLWSTPLPINERIETYLLQLEMLPPTGLYRIRFFQNFLEDEDEVLARDAYDEFARAPYSVVKELKEYMDHDQLIEWISDPNIPPNHRRLYLTMLGVCGSEADLPLLESMMQSEDITMKAGLDAMIGCYLTLYGKEGLPLIDSLFISNQEAEYADTYAAIMALRFHGTEGGVIEQEHIIETIRHMLDRPQLADLVIPDLARWSDWTVMPKMVQLFVDATEKNSWVRVPVVNYLRACPLPEAESHLKRLEEIDPEAIRRANTFFPFGTTAIPGRELPVIEGSQEEESSSRIPAS